MLNYNGPRREIIVLLKEKSAGAWRCAVTVGVLSRKTDLLLHSWVLVAKVCGISWVISLATTTV